MKAWKVQSSRGRVMPFKDLLDLSSSSNAAPSNPYIEIRAKIEESDDYNAWKTLVIRMDTGRAEALAKRLLEHVAFIRKEHNQ